MPVLNPAEPRDAHALARFAAKSFVDTFVHGFGVPYPPEDLQAFLAKSASPAVFAGLIADPARDVRLLRDARGIAAYAVSGPAALPHPDAAPEHAEIARFYLRGDRQGSGLAGAALGELLADLDPNGDRPVWLSVWSGNLRAQRFYARHGFRHVGECDYPVGRFIDHDFVWRRG